jgi:hypothetical protein
MREIDPNADKSGELQMGPEYVPGAPPPTDGRKSLGKEHRFSMKWATENHNALGRYLHAPTIHKLEQGKRPTVEEIIARANGVLKGIANLMDHKLRGLQHIAVIIFLNTLSCIISH